MFEYIPWTALIFIVVWAFLGYFAEKYSKKTYRYLSRKERLTKVLIENRDSYTIDENGFITVKDEAVLKAVKEFSDKMNKRKNNE